MCIYRSLQLVYHSLREKFVTLNLYNSRSTDPATVHYQIISTRLYLTTLVISIFILTLYTAINGPIKNEIVYLPKLALYKKLQKQYPDTLRCPCSKTAIPYGTFVNVEPSFHQVCSSDFISQSWIDFAFETNTTFIWPMDIRTSLSPMWQLIAAVCSGAMKTIPDALNEFSSLPLINPLILPEDLLRTKTHTALDLILQVVSDSSMNMLTVFERISKANGLVTGISTNYVALTLSKRPGGKAQYILQAVARYILQGLNTTCTCMHAETCPIPGSFYLYDMWETSGLYDLNKLVANQTLEGIIVDCTPLQTMLASSLECFYNQSCVDLILSMYSKSINISKLNQFLPSRFMPKTNIKLLTENLFMEQIINKTLYNSYYHQCAPIYCSYTYSSKFDWMYVITILMSLCGGLSIALHITIPYIIDFILFVKKKLRPIQNEPQDNPSMTPKNDPFVCIS
jgi:hypothetical protein